MLYLGLFLLPLFLLGALVFFIVRATTLQRRVTDLEFRLDVLERSVSGLQVQLPEPSKKAKQPTKSSPASVSSSSVPVPVPVSAPAPASPPSRTREEWEAFVGGKLLNRIGAFALIIGVGLFLKYAFDNNWISEGVRVAIGGVSGILCLAGAYQTHRRGFAVFSQGLVGAGIAILYVSVYSSFNYYALVPQWVAFILMSVVTALSLSQAVYYNAIAVGVLGWAGGFLTPWMLNTGSPNEIGLFTYIALLTVALLGLVVRKPEWVLLEVLTLAGVWIVYFVWHVEEYDVDAMTLTMFFVMVFWGAFVATDTALHRFGRSFDAPRIIVSLLNAAMGCIAVAVVLSEESEAGAGWTMVGMAAVYVLAVVFLRPPADGRYAKIQSTVSAALALFGCSLVYSDFSLVISWSVLSAAAAWSATRWKYVHLNIVSLVVLCLAVLELVGVRGGLMTADIEAFSPVFNDRTLGFAVVIIASFAAWRSLVTGEASTPMRSTFLSIGVSCLALLITVEVNDVLRVWRLSLVGDEMTQRWFHSVLILAATWAITGTAFVWTGLRLRFRPVWIVGIVVLGVGVITAILRGFAVVLPDIHVPLLNMRTGILVLTALLSAYVGRTFAFHQHDQGAWKEGYAIASIGAAVTVFSLLTGETRDVFERSIVLIGSTDDVSLRQATVDALRDQQQLSVSGIWLVYSVTLMVFGFLRASRGFRVMAIVLFGITILKIFLYDLSFLETLYRIVSFVALGVILLGVSYAYQRYKYVLLGVPSGQKGAVS
ncbi:MAG TPA: hypothetical protein DCX46_02045 [Bacteroidetes bacterium]|nr:MAG: hypothetical protein A2X68_07675 [Ignavibacteria bacterium GWC2_56_12]HAV22278.1 hypothetical protein [Bacteroidota bacterium]